MPWEYAQSTGKLKHNGLLIATGYAGKDKGKNNPSMEAFPFLGPIPKGLYTIGNPRNTSNRGPHVLDLIPKGHKALGRSEFLIHGDSVKNPGKASEGCIIMPRLVREKIAKSGDKLLKVVN